MSREVRRAPWQMPAMAVLAAVSAAGVVWLGAAMMSMEFGPSSGLGRQVEQVWDVLGGVIAALGLVLLVTSGTAAGLMIWRRNWREYLVMREWLGSRGFASLTQLRESMTARAVIRRARSVRRSLKWKLFDLSTWFIDPRQAGRRLGRTVVGPFIARTVFASLVNVMGVYGGQQMGKTRFLAQEIRTAPGAVLAAGTKADFYEYSRTERELLGPVYVFNPEGIGGHPNTLQIDLLQDCENPRIAHERAAYLVRGTQTGGIVDANFWENKGVSVLRSLLIAAALDRPNGASIHTVAGWISEPTSTRPLTILESFPQVVPSGWVKQMRGLQSTEATRMRDSVYQTLEPALEFVSLPEVADVINPPPGTEPFNLEKALEDNAAIYLIGSDTPNNPMAPLLTALTGYVFEEAKRIAARRPGGRLDPQLSLVLDEVSLITPVPLDRWSADSAGRGITITFATQSPSQIAERWGERAAQTIHVNSNTEVYLGGFKDPFDEQISKLCGEVEAASTSTTRSNGRDTSETSSPRNVRVLPPHKVREVPDGYAIVIDRFTRGTVIKLDRRFEPAVDRASHRWAVRMAKRRGRLEIPAPTDMPATTSPAQGVPPRPSQPYAIRPDRESVTTSAVTAPPDRPASEPDRPWWQQ